MSKKATGSQTMVDFHVLIDVRSDRQRRIASSPEQVNGRVRPEAANQVIQ